MTVKPENLAYGVDEKPPLLALIFLGLQLVSCSAASLVMPVIIAQAVNAPQEVAISLVAVSMIAWAIGAILQIQRSGPIGSGYLALPNNSGTYLAPSMLAVHTGGLSLVAGMTVIAGLFHTIIAPFLRHLRKWLPPEIGAVVLILIGLQLGALGLDRLLGMNGPEPTNDIGLHIIGWLSLFIMFITNIWFKKGIGRYCVLIGISVGYLLTFLCGYSGTTAKFDIVQNAHWFGMPRFAMSGYSYNHTLLAPFLIAALISAVKTSSLITVAQKSNDANWSRPDMKNISKGNIADGLGCLISGIYGSMGQNISSSSVAIPAQTGVTSRYIAYPFAAFFIFLALCPKFIAIFLAIPDTIIGAMLLFTGITVLSNGHQIISQRLLDTRRTVIIGLTLILGLSFPLHPDYYAHLPKWIQQFTGSSYTIAAIVGIILNFFFQIGNSKISKFVINPNNNYFEFIDKKLQSLGRQWSVRRDVMLCATLALKELVEMAISQNCNKEDILVKVHFDDINLRVILSYKGEIMSIKNMCSNYGAQKQTGSSTYSLRNCAGKVKVSPGKERVRLALKFEH
jgi:xanthine permease XanP